WRHFGAKYIDYKTDYTGQGVDQLANLVNKLKQDSESRRLIVNSWNAADLDKMALPPCHDSFQVLANPKTKKLDFIWRQRSTDTMVGLPFNIASYALLQNLLAQEVGYVPGKLIGHLGDVHIYLPHIENAKIQLERAPYELPEVKVENFSGIFNCNYLDIKAKNYRRHPKLEYEVIT
ncbi:MAG TPA: thymidylate synthase, partial [Candidatus Pacearchaeota archaeon]|nr:thymidylate synthase [Candidatus Pacearchaeota archaeon]